MHIKTQPAGALQFLSPQSDDSGAEWLHPCLEYLLLRAKDCNVFTGNDLRPSSLYGMAKSVYSIFPR